MTPLIHEEPTKLENGTPFQADAAPVLEWAGFSIHLARVRHLVQDITCTPTMVTLTGGVNQFASKLK